MQDCEMNQWLLDLLKLKPERSHSAATRSPNHETISSDLITLENWQGLLDKAIEQQVGALLYSQLQSLPDLRVPLIIQESLKDIYRKNTFFNLALMGELKSILSLFNSHKIPVIVLKGAYLAKEVYSKIGLREMVDIDLLVPDDKVEQAAKLLEILDYQSIRNYDVSLDVEKLSGHQLPPFRKSFALPVIEIHWTICDPNETYQFDLTELWQRAKNTDFFGETALALAPEDLILHLCHHASYHHKFNIGVRPLCDLARIIEHFQDQLDWQALQTTAERWQWQKGLYIMLAFAHYSLGVDLPNLILQAIEHGGIDQPTLAITKDELFVNRSTNNQHLSFKMTIPLVNFIEQPHFMEKIKLMIQQIFLNAQMMSERYPVESKYTDPKLYFYYLIRIRDLWQRYYQYTQQSMLGNTEASAVTRRKYLLNQWLQEKSQ
jgi:hypothetical protein